MRILLEVMALSFLILPSGGWAAEPATVISGRVVGPDGVPLGDARVDVIKLQDLGFGLRLDQAEVRKSVRTGPDGVFRMVYRDRNVDCICCCDALLRVDQGDRTVWSGRFLLGRGAVVLRDLVLAPSVSPRLVLRDSEGHPVSDAEVKYDVDGIGRGIEPGLPVGFEQTVLSDRRGVAELLLLLPPGTHRNLLVPIGYETVELDLAVPPAVSTSSRKIRVHLPKRSASR